MPVPHLVRGPQSAKVKTPGVAGRVQCATGVGALVKRASSRCFPTELRARAVPWHSCGHGSHLEEHNSFRFLSSSSRPALRYVSTAISHNAR